MELVVFLKSQDTNIGEELNEFIDYRSVGLIPVDTIVKYNLPNMCPFHYHEIL